MRLACEARTLHVPRETPSLPRALDSSFFLKDSSTVQYTLLFYHWTPYLYPYLIVKILRKDLIGFFYYIVAVN
jgi:hypothetical protein